MLRKKVYDGVNHKNPHVKHTAYRTTEDIASFLGVLQRKMRPGNIAMHSIDPIKKFATEHPKPQGSILSQGKHLTKHGIGWLSGLEDHNLELPVSCLIAYYGVILGLWIQILSSLKGNTLYED